jgi:hypothetical protein
MEEQFSVRLADKQDELSLERWLMSNGKIGECPEWYGRLLLARQLQIPPWEIDFENTVHQEWIERAVAAQRIENQAAERRQQQLRSRLGAAR